MTVNIIEYHDTPSTEQILNMTDSTSNSRGNCHPIYHTSPLTLQELASMRIALCIWLDKFRQGCPTPNELTFDIKHLHLEIGKSCKFKKKLPIKFKIMIYICIGSVNKEMKSWYESWRSVLHLDDYNNRNRFDLVVFGGNGTVHAQQTIVNFLEDDFLSNIQKFEIACKRCMEVKVDSIWPLVSKKFSLKGKISSSDPLLYYWICRKRGELNRIPLEDFDRIEHLMIAKCCDLSYFFAVQYFLNLLDPHDRIDQINQMLQYNTGFICVKSLLPHLESHIQHYVFGKRLKILSFRFIEKYQSIGYIVQTWLHIQHSFTPERFYQDIIKKFTSGAYTCLKTLTSIWANTPLHLKEYTLKNHLSYVLDKLYRKYTLRKYCSRNIGIILAILSDADVSSNVSYWKNNWEKWDDIISAPKFKELLETGVIKPEAILDLEKFPLGSEKLQRYCLELMEKGLYTVLDEILNILHLTEEQVAQFKKQILASFDPYYFSGSHEKMEIHSKYIDGVFSGNEQLSQDFKESWILSDKAWNVILSSVRCESFETVQSVISVFVSSNSLQECKSKLLEVYRTTVIDGNLQHYDSYKLEKFLLWCVGGDEQRVDDFWASFSIDNIFEVRFLKEIRLICETEYRNRSAPLFDRKGSKLNQFLKGYFKSKPKFENFKREKIEYYERMDETEARSKFHRDKWLVIAVLKEGFLMADDEI